MNIAVGIDPGMDGAIAVLWRGGLVQFHDTPMIKVKGGRVYDVAALAAIFEVFPPAATRVWVEAQQAMPGQGVSSTFKTGYGFGIYIGILGALALPYTVVRAANWKKTMMADMAGKDKGGSIVRALQIDPTLHDHLKRKKDHGRADAYLIARYGLKCRRD